MTDVMVLCYHALSRTWEAPLSVTPENFERQLGILKKRGWHAVSFAQAVVDPTARRTLAVTFDDAFASVRELALPLLTALGWPATVFAPTSFMSCRQHLHWQGIDHWRDSPDARELLCMDWNDLGELAEVGWEIGSHTHSHPHLTTLSDSELREELERSRSECMEQLGRPCVSIAYPYGDVDQRVAGGARAAGYRAGAALASSLRGMDPLQWPRMGIYHVDTRWRFQLKRFRAMRALRASPLWPDKQHSS